MITRDDIKRFSPKAKPEYVDALMAGTEVLREAGILESEYRLCHFMAQMGHETGGFTIIREFMGYKPARARQVWPARFRNMSDADLKRLCADPVRFSDHVYGGRMGNRKGTADGYNFRGAGWIQTTGRSAFQSYAKRCGLPDDDESLAKYASDLGILLKFAIAEWTESQCNAHADENDLTKVCKAINTGSATSNIKPVGMTDRQKWFAKAWGIWGDRGKPDVPNDDGMTTKQKLGVAAGGAAVTAGPSLIQPGFDAILNDPSGTISTLVSVKSNAVQLVPAGISLSGLMVPALILAIAIGAAIYLGRR